MLRAKVHRLIGCFIRSEELERERYEQEKKKERERRNESELDFFSK